MIYKYWYFEPIKGMDLTEAGDKEEVARTHWRAIQKDLHDPDNHDDVITHLEPDIPEWEFNGPHDDKASGGDGIPVELFHILKDGAVKVLYLICQQIWKTQQWP